MTNEWQSPEHAAEYLARADRVPHRALGEAVLLEHLPSRVDRVLDLGAGDGRLLQLVLGQRPEAHGVALDFSPPMLTALRTRFDQLDRVEVIDHNMESRLPDLGRFDAVVSSFAIHHLVDGRKQKLYGEIFSLLHSGGVFCNLEHVLPSSTGAHERFLKAMGISAGDEDPSNKLLDVHTQLDWLRAIGFVDVDCAWKWYELALLVGRKP